MVDINNKRASRCCIELNDETLMSQACRKNLGVFVNNDLNFVDHLQKVSFPKLCNFTASKENYAEDLIQNFSDSVSQLFSDKEVPTVYELYLYDLLTLCLRVANKIHGHEVFGHYFLIKSCTRVTRSSSKSVFETPVFKSKL